MKKTESLFPRTAQGQVRVGLSLVSQQASEPRRVGQGKIYKGKRQKKCEVLKVKVQGKKVKVQKEKQKVVKN